MSVTTEITRIQSAKADIAKAIKYREGSNVSSSLLSDTALMNAINNIEGVLHYNPRTGHYISYNGDFYAKLCEYPLWFYCATNYTIKLTNSSSGIASKTFKYATTTTTDAYEQPDLTGKSWRTMTLDSPISVNGGTFFCVKSTSTTYVSNSSYNRYFTIGSSKYPVYCGGNIQSLMNMSTTLPSGASFRGLFKNNTASLKSCPLLPYKDLSSGNKVYYEMFYGCSNLEYPPILPATVLGDYCYYSMFQQCQSMKYFPDLPAPEFKPYCYSNMFSTVKKATRLKCMTYKNYVSSATNNWLNYNTPYFGFFISPHPEIFSRNQSGIPNGWIIMTNEYNISQYNN